MTVVMNIQPRPPEAPLSTHISYSQLNTFLMCPMLYAHRYLYRTEPESRSVNMILGSSIHQVADIYYKSFQEDGNKPQEDALLAVYESAFAYEMWRSEVPLSLQDGTSIEDVKAQGVGLVKLFMESVNPQKVIGTEIPFAVSIPDMENGGDLPFTLNGVFDLVEADAEGSYMVGELKTAAARYPEYKLQHDLQPTAYSYALWKMGVSTEPDSTLIRYDVLLKNKKPQFIQYFITRGESDHLRLIHTINQVARAIQAEVYWRNTGWQCVDCSYKKACLG